MNANGKNFFLQKNVLKNENLLENHEVCVLHWIKGEKILSKLQINNKNRF